MGSKPVVAAFLVLLFAPAAHAADSLWVRQAQRAHASLGRSVKAGYLDEADANRYLGILSHARVVHARTPPLRARILERVLAEVATPKSPTAPRALELYTTLQENTDYLAKHRVPADGADVAGEDGALYRAFAGALQFHPLANASRLNALVAAGDTEGVRALVDALAARAIPQPGGADVWEYRFDFGAVRAPWTSGMAQAVLAQALARAGDSGLARRAYRAIPGSLDRELPAGPWIRLYSGNRLLVLNAQLQSAISIGDYAALTQDAGAADYANELLAATKAMLPRFDTGHWSRYSLGVESDLHYQDFVIGLLKTLGKRTGDPAWTGAAQRFELYETEPPLLTGPSATRLVYPRPEDGVRDELVVRFWLSKIAKVVLVVDGKAADGYTWGSGWHTFRFVPVKLAAGTHKVRLIARSLDGNPGSTELGTFEVARDTVPPALAAAKSGGRVFWRAKDGESACCRIRLELRQGGRRQVLAPSRVRGSTRIPAGYWLVTVVARDAAGNRTDRALGLVVGRQSKAR